MGTTAEPAEAVASAGPPGWILVHFDKHTNYVLVWIRGLALFGLRGADRFWITQARDYRGIDLERNRCVSSFLNVCRSVPSA